MKDLEDKVTICPVEFDENMPEMPKSDETAVERASRMDREAERSGTEAEWNEIANPDDAAPPAPEAHPACRSPQRLPKNSEQFMKCVITPTRLGVRTA